MTQALLNDLEWRGLIAQSTDREALVKDLEAGPVSF
jgi:tyrosyl-tRNA synthetase